MRLDVRCAVHHIAVYQLPHIISDSQNQQRTQRFSEVLQAGNMMGLLRVLAVVLLFGTLIGKLQIFVNTMHAITRSARCLPFLCSTSWESIILQPKLPEHPR